MSRNYQELKQRVALLIDRDDATEQITYDDETIDKLDEFICNAERRFYRDELVYTPPFEFTTGKLKIPGRTAKIAVPGNYFGLRYAVATTGDYRYLMERTSAEDILTGTLDDVTYLPTKIAYSSQEFVWHPASQEIELEIFYYGALPTLASQTAENNIHWLLNHADDLIIYWAAVEAALYYNSSDLAGMTTQWEAKAKDIRDSIIKQDKRARQSGTTPRIGRFYHNPPRISPNVGAYGRR